MLPDSLFPNSDIPRLVTKYENSDQILENEDIHEDTLTQELRYAKEKGLLSERGNLTKYGALKAVNENGGKAEIKADLRNKRGSDWNPVDIVLEDGELKEGEEIVDAIKDTLEREKTRIKPYGRNIRADLSVNKDKAKEIGRIYGDSRQKMLKNGSYMIEGRLEKANVSGAKKLVTKNHYYRKWTDTNAIEANFGMSESEIASKLKDRKLQLTEGSFSSEKYPSYKLEGDLPEFLKTSFRHSPSTQSQRLRTGFDGEQKLDIGLKGEKKTGKQIKLSTTVKPENQYVGLDLKIWGYSLNNTFESNRERL